MASKAKTQQENKIARVHGGQSNRRTKDRGESRTVLKSVLSNPLEVKWPIIPQNVQDSILDRVIELLQGIAEYNLSRRKQTRETRATKRAEKRQKKYGQGAMNVDAPQQQQTGENAAPSASTSTVPAPAPEILQHLTIGINAVTKRLEEQCCIPRQIIKVSPPETLTNHPTAAAAKPDAEREEVATDDETTGNANSTDACPAATREPIRIVLVCLPDIDPPLLVAHVPYLVAACNSKDSHVDDTSATTTDNNDNRATHDPAARIKLVPLPKGAELKLAKATGLRRISILAFDETVSRDEVLSQHLSSIEATVAPWLMGFGAADTAAPAVHASTTSKSRSKSQTKPKTISPEHARMLRRRLEPTHIKQLRTTAPKDMRAAKALRAKGRALAKEKRKIKDALEKPKPTRKRKTKAC